MEKSITIPMWLWKGIREVLQNNWTISDGEDERNNDEVQDLDFRMQMHEREDGIY